VRLASLQPGTAPAPALACTSRGAGARWVMRSVPVAVVEDYELDVGYDVTAPQQ
jgi:hypothetical protein